MLFNIKLILFIKTFKIAYFMQEKTESHKK
jgi:hypothetical protein